MVEPAEVEVVDGPLVPINPALIQSAPVEQVVAMQQAYHQLCAALLDDSDYQTIGDKRFKKKSAWRKLSVAFNVSTELLKEDVERGPRGRIERVQCTVRALAPNGRFQDGIGACDIHERCCDSSTCTRWETWPDSGRPTGHVHCDENCTGRQHFSNPSHDIPATAMTRATNRAQADLFGMGEVSAEEIVDNGRFQPESRETAQDRSGAPQTSQPSRGGMKMAQKAQIDRIGVLVGPNINPGPVIQGIIPTFTSPEGLTFAEARHVIDQLEKSKSEAS